MSRAPPNIVLAGFMGCGKTTVGLLLAERLDRPFVDTDAELEARAGRPVRQIFADEGEPAFRLREATLCAQLASVGGLIIACGGGALLDPRSRAALQDDGRVICLDATLAAVHERLGGATERPLLLDGDGAIQPEQITALWRDRRAHYESFSERIDTSDMRPEEVVEAVLQSLLAAG